MLGKKDIVQLWTGCHNVFSLPPTRIRNKKFPVIMCYYCEDIISIFLVWKENWILQSLLTANYKSNKRNQSKEMKSILHDYRQNAILGDHLMYTQILIDISCEPMQISPMLPRWLGLWQSGFGISWTLKSLSISNHHQKLFKRG